MLKRALVTAAVLLALLAGGFAIRFVQTYRHIEGQGQVDEARPADAILVLGAAVYPGERPSPTLRARVQQAVRLYQSGIAPTLMLSGGVGRWPPSEAEVMRRLALAAGVPDAALVLDEAAYSTLDSIRHAGARMAERGWHSVVIVSDAFHLPRALAMARDSGLQAYGSPATDSPTSRSPGQRSYYTFREALALMWYQITERGVFG